MTECQKKHDTLENLFSRADTAFGNAKFVSEPNARSVAGLTMGLFAIAYAIQGLIPDELEEEHKSYFPIEILDCCGNRRIIAHSGLLPLGEPFTVLATNVEE